MSAAVEIPKPTDHRRLDEVVGRLRENARTFATLPIAEKIALAKSMLEGQAKVQWDAPVHTAALRWGT